MYIKYIAVYTADTFICQPSIRSRNVKIVISSQSELPIYAQIEEQIRNQILDGTIPEGTLLPSIRKLARETGVSVITTTRAYSDLESRGYIASQPGRGSIVLPQNNKLLREQYRKEIGEDLTHAIATARQIQMDRQEFDSILDTLWDS